MTFLAAEPTGLSGYLPFLVIIGVFALFIVFSSRQRKKQMAQQQAMYTQLGAGTPVVLTSGFKGTVESVDGENVRVELAPGTVVTVLKQAVMRIDSAAQTPGDDLVSGDDRASGEPRDDPGGTPPGTDN